MIGGIDVRLPTRAGAVAVQVAVRAVRDHWPQAVFENGDTGMRYDQFRQIPFGELNEVFVYRDRRPRMHGMPKEPSRTCIIP